MTTPPAVLERAADPCATKQELSELIKGAPRDLLLVVASNPAASQKALRKLVNSPYEDVRAAAAQNPSASERIRTIYAEGQRTAAPVYEPEPLPTAPVESKGEAIGQMIFRAIPGLMLAGVAGVTVYSYTESAGLTVAAALVGFLVGLLFPQIFEALHGV